MLVLALALFVPFEYSLLARVATPIAVLYFGVAWLVDVAAAPWCLRTIGSFGTLVVLFVCIQLVSIASNARLFVYQDYVEVIMMLTCIGSAQLFFSIGKSDLLYGRFACAFSWFCVLYVAVNLGQLYDYYAGDDLRWFYSAYAPLHTADVGVVLAERGEFNRYTGLSANPNSHAAVLCLLLLTTVYLARQVNWRRYLSAALLLLIVLTQSRTALVAIGVLFTPIVCASAMRARKRLRYVAILVLAAAMSAWLIDRLNLSFVSSIVKESPFEQQTLLTRVERWGPILEMTWASPLFGNAPSQDWFAREGIHADSEYVLVMWRYGLVGLLIFGCILAFPMATAWRLQAKHQGLRQLLVSLTVVVAVLSCTNVTLTDYRACTVYAMVCGLACGRIHALRRVDISRQLEVGARDGLSNRAR